MDAETNAPILDIQRFSLHDGPGIRTLVFLKGCPLRCDWCQNPESQERRPVIGFYAGRCHDYLECRHVCEKTAVRETGHRVDYQACNVCMACVNACPTGSLQLLGRRMTVDGVVETVMQDEEYYRTSGGGLTVTGGEPLLYAGFVASLFEKTRSRGIRNAVETCGHFSWARALAALRTSDLIYFDLKLMDNALHKKHTGADNALIQRNAEALVAGGFPVEFRIPLVPLITDTDSNLSALCLRLRELGQKTVHLLRYHNMGESKIGVINGKQPRLGLSQYSEEAYAGACALVESYGLAVA